MLLVYQNIWTVILSLLINSNLKKIKFTRLQNNRVSYLIQISITSVFIKLMISPRILPESLKRGQLVSWYMLIHLQEQRCNKILMQVVVPMHSKKEEKDWIQNQQLEEIMKQRFWDLKTPIKILLSKQKRQIPKIKNRKCKEDNLW